MKKYCDGTGICFRRFKKYEYGESRRVKCNFNCKLIKCAGCFLEAPEWYYAQYTSGMCYECNLITNKEEEDSDEERYEDDISFDDPYYDYDLASDTSSDDEETTS